MASVAMPSKTREQLTPTVRVNSGVLRGRAVSAPASFGGAEYYSFQGIRYAEPPIGHLRFKAPVPVKPWDGVRDAWSTGPKCPQIDYVTKEIVGDEDCLRLNVYVPREKLSDPWPSPFYLLPVMVFIHGGMFEMGSSDTEVYGPEYIMRNGRVILITFNYRLGPLGFCNLETEDIPGNAGLMDQVLALQWVQENISRFRGNPDNVTIFGESAGAISCLFHTVSQLSKGLFHRVIAMSGSSLMDESITDSSKARTIRLASILGCKSPQDTKAIADLLISVPAYSLVENKNKVLSKEEKTGMCDIVFQPNIQSGSTSSEEAFLTAHPRELIRTGRIEQVPIILGQTSMEGGFYAFFIENQQDFYNFWDREENNIHFIPFQIRNKYKGNTKKLNEIALKIRREYFDFRPISPESCEQMAELFSDLWFILPIYNLHRELQNAGIPAYNYLFSYDTPRAITKKMLTSRLPRHLDGAFHADDLSYLFRNVSQEGGLPQEDLAFSQEYIKIFTSFAISGDPTTDLGTSTPWRTFCKDDPCYLNIDELLSVIRGLPFSNRIAFWERLFDHY